MCGISGIVGRIEPGDIDRIQRANEALAHRGPDDTGLWNWSREDGAFGAVLGHRRLSIIDLRHVAAQPMVDDEHGTVLVFNGEIYNFKPLREELTAAGHHFMTEGDSEVILRGYAEWGEGVVARLRGMFAFVLVDPRKQRALFARDGMGIKPLYIAEVRDGTGVRAIAFASETRALVKAGYADATTDQGRIGRYLWNGFSTAPSTLWRDIDEFPRGAFGIATPETRLETTRYWAVGNGQGNGANSDARAMLEESVALHLVSDVPKVVFLSGGIDSSAVAALARRHEANLETMSLGFANREADETAHAEAVAQAIGTRHHSVLVTPEQMLADLDRSIAALDQPSFDGGNVWLVSKQAAALGFKVALAGTGGDELAGGYTSFRRLPKLQRLLGAVPGPAAELAAQILALAMPARARRLKLRDLAGTGGNLAALYQTQYALRTRRETQALLGDGGGALDLSGLAPERLADLVERVRHLSPLRAVSLLESELFLGDRLLRDADSTSMDHSIELRVPFVDTALSDGFDALPEDERYEPLGSKGPLRRICYEAAGQALIDRPKRGFELPIEHWLRAELREVVSATLCDAAACRRLGLAPDAVAQTWREFLDRPGQIYWTRIWALFVLLRWADINGMACAG